MIFPILIQFQSFVFYDLQEDPTIPETETVALLNPMKELEESLILFRPRLESRLKFSNANSVPIQPLSV
jgi:hypothetical protein